MLKNAIQEEHKKILKKKESELIIERINIEKSLNEAYNELNILRENITKNGSISKTK